MSGASKDAELQPGAASGAGEIFWVFLRLGLTSFGGPVAHLGYFRDEFVSRRKWLSDQNYGDLVALCQMLPGPASSQTGIGIGLARAGMSGAFAAWAGFTLPSAILMTLIGLGLTRFGGSIDAGPAPGTDDRGGRRGRPGHHWHGPEPLPRCATRDFCHSGRDRCARHADIPRPSRRYRAWSCRRTHSYSGYRPQR